MSKKSKKKARKAAKRAANKNAILKKDKPKTVEQNTGSPFPNFTAQTDNRKSNFKYIQPTAKTAKQTAKQQRADGAKNEKWQDEKYAAHMQKQAAKQKAKDKPAKKKAKLTKKELTDEAKAKSTDLLQGASVDAIEIELKPNTNVIQIRNDLKSLKKILEQKSTSQIKSKLYKRIRQALCDILTMVDNPNAAKHLVASRILLPALGAMTTDFFMRGGTFDPKKL